MKAAIYRSYGPPEVLKIEDIDPPVLQEEHEGRVLIQIYYASVNPFDYLHRKGYFPIRLVNGLFAPKEQIQRLGIDVAGTIAAIGKNVTRFKVGDPIFGNCVGSHAEYVRARENAICLLPNNITFKEAAAIPTAALTALQALRDVARIEKNQKVLINGASGGVGHFAVQIARFYEADVTAVCSTPNLGWVKDLGAGTTIDYTREDFTRNGEKYDIILDVAATHTYFRCKPSLTRNGVYITENPLKPAYRPFQILFASLTGDKRGKSHLSLPNEKDMAFLQELIEQGQLHPMIEKVYPLDQIMDAHRHVENGHTKGKVVVEILKG